jgi:hypothetical protein
VRELATARTLPENWSKSKRASIFDDVQGDPPAFSIDCEMNRRGKNKPTKQSSQARNCFREFLPVLELGRTANLDVSRSHEILLLTSNHILISIPV